MKRLKFLNIFFLSMLILIGSVVDVHLSLASIDSQASEITREIEDVSDSVVPLVAHFISSFFFIELPASVLSIELGPKFIFTVPQLLCSNRIALPPPYLS